MSNRAIFLNFDLWCDWIGYAADLRVHAVMDDIQ